MHSTSSNEVGYDDDNNILSEIYKSNIGGRKKFLGRNFDAYTKLAGEGDRFMCVRNNMGRLTNNTVFYAYGETE